MRESLQRNVSEMEIAEVRAAAPAFVVVEVTERTRPTRFVPVVDCCFERSAPLCTG